MVRMVPVCFQADGTEDVATWDGHWVPEIFLTEVAGVWIRRHGENLVLLSVAKRRCPKDWCGLVRAQWQSDLTGSEGVRYIE